MQQAAEEAARVAQVPVAAAPPPPPSAPTPVDQASVIAMNNARNSMNDAKRAAPAGDTRKAAAEEARARQLEQDGKFTDAATAYRNAATYYNDATTAQRVADAVESEKQNIRKLMDRYKSAYETKDRAAMKTIFPNLPKLDAENLANSDFASFQVDLNYVDIQVTGTTANAAYGRTLIPKARGQGRVIPPTAPQQVVFGLRKDGSNWTIQSMDIKK